MKARGKKFGSGKTLRTAATSRRLKMMRDAVATVQAQNEIARGTDERKPRIRVLVERLMATRR